MDDAWAQSVVQRFDAQAGLRPGAPALLFADRAVTYSELRRASERIAAQLITRTGGGNALVPVICSRGPEMVAALLGVLRAGAAYVPIDPGFPADRVRMMIEDSGAGVCVCDEAHRALAPGLAVVEAATAFDERGSQSGAIGHGAGSHGPHSLAYVIYTSGSTGKPKGVMLEHAGLSNLIAAFDGLLGCKPGDVLVSVTTISFDIAALELFLPLTTGGVVALASRDEALDGVALAGLIERHGASVLQATPATWRLLLDAGWKGCAGLRALVGGEAVPARLASELLPRVGELWNVYGPTETTIWSTAHRVTRADLDSAEGTSVPIGRALPGNSVRVVDEKGRPLPDGQAGELLIGGVGVARGYHNRPDLTNARFFPDTIMTQAERALDPREPTRLYRTGDLVRVRPDGVIDFIGRTDSQVKVRGFRVELGEIDAALCCHPAVREGVAGVRGTDESRWLAAYVTPREGRRVEGGELIAWVAQRLPHYMVPSRVVVLDQMPLTPNRKIDRAALSAMPLDEAAVVRTSRAVDLRDDIEVVTAEVLGGLLGLGMLGPEDDFFTLGGHSLLAVRAAKELAERTHQAATPADVFELRTVRRIAERLRGLGGIARRSTVVQLQGRGDQTPLFCLMGVAVYMPLAEALAPDIPVYGVYLDTDVQVFHGDERLRDKHAVTTAAEAYADEVIKHRPKGPYRLAGLSMGGAVAVEVARLLQWSGERVELVAMFDTMLHGSSRRIPHRWAVFHARRALWHLTHLTPSRRDSAPKLPGRELTSEELRAIDVERRGDAAMRGYRPEPIDLAAIMFNAQDRPRPRHYEHDESGGWSTVIRGGLDIIPVRGDHLSMLDPANVGAVASALRRRLLLPGAAAAATV
jgi:amino acid adenylation domain-containing protein